MHSSLTKLFAELDQFEAAIPLSLLRRRMKSLQLTRNDFGNAVRFGKPCYRRNLIHAGPAYQALVLCWRSGQRSPIHDHRGSACALRVIEGIATETIFDISPSGLLYATRTAHAKTGYISATYDMDIHQMGNLQPVGNDLITLHIYSPALLAMGTYFLGNSVLGEDDRAVSAMIRRRVQEKSFPVGLSTGQRVQWSRARRSGRLAASNKRASRESRRSRAHG